MPPHSQILVQQYLLLQSWLLKLKAIPLGLQLIQVKHGLSFQYHFLLQTFILLELQLLLQVLAYRF